MWSNSVTDAQHMLKACSGDYCLIQLEYSSEPCPSAGAKKHVLIIFCVFIATRLGAIAAPRSLRAAARRRSAAKRRAQRPRAKGRAVALVSKAIGALGAHRGRGDWRKRPVLGADRARAASLAR